MSPALRQSLVVGAFATLLSVTATLALSSITRPTVVLATPSQAVGTNPGHDRHAGDHHHRRRHRLQAA